MTWLKSPHKQSLFVKLAVYFSISLLLVSIATIYLTTTRVVNMNEETNARFNKNLLNNLAVLLEELYTDVDNMTKIFAYEGNLGNPFLKYMAVSEMDADTYYDIANEEFSYFFANINKSSYIIASIIVQKSNEETPFFLSLNNTALKSGYRFAEHDWYKNIKENKRKLTVIRTNVPDYLVNLNQHKEVLTFARNIYDIRNITDIRDLGTILIHLDLSTIRHLFERYVNSMDEIFYILDQDGFVIYDNQSRLTGDIFPYFGNIFPDITDSPEGKRVVMLTESNLMNYMTVPSLGWKVVSFLPKSKLDKGLSLIRRDIILITSVSTAVLLLTIMLISQQYLKRLLAINKSIRKMETGDFSTPVRATGNDEIHQLGNSIDNMRQRLKEYIEISYVSQLRLQEAELKALQMQINPHFLYNTLEVIRMKATLNNDPTVAKMIKILADIFRWNVKDRDAVVSIEEEFMYTSIFLDLQRIRYGDRLVTTIDLPADLHSMGILKLILQPLVENAVVHGFRNKEDTCKIHITCRRIDGDIQIDVHDNGEGISEDELSAIAQQIIGTGSFSATNETDEHVGIRNVHDRVAIVFGQPYGLSLTSVMGQGTTVSIRFPAIKTTEMRNHVKSFNS
ncbi:sensor histidine kinase [Paenibacillus etheri]|uniref:HAMP domain-containing protein n=1 Tax=Paenibacillus etheri TaxID=1306852 RepID=A0A0W1AV87_9BACL|nr:sensor histidine kinase [Paenibacillus etheri]KTD85259.1 hypothetical protein UQ64_21720 [Paenibacillus etheri]